MCANMNLQVSSSVCGCEHALKRRGDVESIQKDVSMPDDAREVYCLDIGIESGCCLISRAASSLVDHVSVMMPSSTKSPAGAFRASSRYICHRAHDYVHDDFLPIVNVSKELMTWMSTGPES